MDRSLSRRQFIAASFTGFSAASLAGCGTILYPERRGQPAGQLDWAIVAMDGIGLLLFFVPGVIAFAVDFSTGAIYLPGGGYGSNDGKRELKRIEVPVDELTPQRIEQVISQDLHQPIDLRTGEYVTHPLSSIDGFWDASDRLVATAESK